jgi:exopolysaccharide biosynthesis glucuronosyltransferase PssE
VILVTVGTQLPFDRLVEAVDHWAGWTSFSPVFAQIGASRYHPRNMQWARFLGTEEFRSRLEQATVIVSHAGIGSLLAAIEAQKPLIVLPRLASLGEQRNDHQLATARWLSQLSGISVVRDTVELFAALGHADRGRPDVIRAEASSELLGTVREFINDGLT